ncbi:MAG: AmmeMemoRadiSam system protein B [Desulfatibacillaceae bacterium]
MTVRKADFAGSWYPGSALECERQIKDFLSDGPPALEGGIKGLGGIVPHAGWHFSGKIAALVLAAMQTDGHPDVMAVFGMHLAPGHPNFIMAEGAWETPFGPLEIAEDVAGRLTQRFSFQLETPNRHVQDNTIELQLPFIRYLFPDTRIVPMGVAPAEESLEIGRAFVDECASLGYKSKILGSTDLTHYGPNYGFTPKGTGEQAYEWVREENDPAFIEKVVALDPEAAMKEGVGSHNACCAGAAAAAVAAAKHLGASHGQVVQYATSYDKNPGPSFVGYVGVVF